MRRDRLLYISYQILDAEKRIYHQGIPSLKEAQFQLELMAKIAEKEDTVTVERIDADHLRINGNLFYIFNSTPRDQF